ncbi:MAG: selenium cofactor biosynthesis protein YqeC [Acidimicrobiales bacterium]
MSIGDAIHLLLPLSGAVVSIVGAGGKTTVLFELGESLANRGSNILLTTTTNIFDPRVEPDRQFDHVLLEAGLAEPFEEPGPFQEPGVIPPFLEHGTSPETRGRLIVLGSREVKGADKLQGIHPSWMARLSRDWAYVLVEADGAKGRSIKAPGDHEPVVPPSTGAVIGVVGLDCLGRPMDGATVHRPERFQAVTGLAAGPLETDLTAVCSHEGSNIPGHVLMLAFASGFGTGDSAVGPGIAEEPPGSMLRFGACR